MTPPKPNHARLTLTFEFADKDGVVRDAVTIIDDFTEQDVETLHEWNMSEMLRGFVLAKKRWTK